MTRDQQTASHAEASDKPQKKTVLVNAYRERTGRVEFIEVTWEEYLELYDRKFLKFLRDGTPRPDHLPDRETAQRWASIKTPDIPEKPKNTGWGESFAGNLKRNLKPRVPKPPSRPIVVEEVPEPEIIPEVVPEELDLEVVADLPVQDEPLVVVQKRRTAAEKIQELEKTALELKEKRRSFTAADLFRATAKRIGMNPWSLRTFFQRDLPKETRDRMLLGEAGKQPSRAEEKFAILMRVRDEMRKAGKPAPNKKELIDAAAKPLGMLRSSASIYVYEKLTEAQTIALEFRPPPAPLFTEAEQLAVLKRIRKEMRDKGLPAPRQIDLAAAAVPILKQKETSIRTLINKLSKEEKEELDFMQSRSRSLVGLSPEVIREGFIGAIAVLKLRRVPLTTFNLRIVLRLKPAVIEKYLADNPDIAALLRMKNT